MTMSTTIIGRNRKLSCALAIDYFVCPQGKVESPRDAMNSATCSILQEVITDAMNRMGMELRALNKRHVAWAASSIIVIAASRRYKPEVGGSPHLICPFYRMCRTKCTGLRKCTTHLHAHVWYKIYVHVERVPHICCVSLYTKSILLLT